ncbi:MAG: LysR substrate-binding domain-containing protein [Bacteroidota bacterium]
MTLQQLQYVVALDTHRHFVRASESCHVSQPTLTIQVKKLEEQMSTILFDRSQQPLVPTPIGSEFIKKARRILREIEELKELVNDERDRIDGEFRLGIIPTLAPNLLPLFVGDFLEKHPDTRLVIEELQSERIMEKLEQKQLDLGLLATPLNEPNIREIPLFYEPFLIFANTDQPILEKSPIHSSDLQPEGLWLMRQGHCLRNQTLNVCQFDLSKNPGNLIMEGGSIETLKRMVQSVSGYTLIPELSFDADADAGHVVRFEDPQPVREVSIVVHKHFTKERLLTELRRSILAHTPESFKKNTRFVTVKWR